MDPNMIYGIDFDLTVPIEVRVEDHDGVEGDDFDLYFHEQRGDWIMPAAGGTIRTGSPEPGRDNAYLLAHYGVSLGGRLAPPTATTRAGIHGLLA